MTDEEKAERRLAMVAAARECIGTPWHHQARLVGVGMDCLGIFAHVARAVGDDLVVDQADYGKLADMPRLTASWAANGSQRLTSHEALPGDMIIFRINMKTVHVGMVSGVLPLSFVHIPATGRRKGEEIVLSDFWFQLIHSVWRAKALRDDAA